MADEDDVAWTITTGYYPELAAGLNYKSGAGRGAVGAKYIKKRGFTDTSIVREKTKSWKDEAKSAGAVGEGDAGSLEGKALFAEKTYTDKKTGAAETYWKFRGGSETYKLHGDQVWYMAGTRPKDNNLSLIHI